MAAYRKVVMIIMMLFSFGNHYFGVIADQPTVPVAGKLQEYCTGETFHPICHNNKSVIVMKKAEYGRMKIGKCAKSDIGEFIADGCYRNVLPIADRLCSGLLGSCRIPLPNTEMRNEVDCLSEVTAYFEAEYACQEVYIPKRLTCASPEKVTIEHNPGFIASVVSKHTSCGISHTPWVLNAKPGQKIAISIIDFNWKNTNDSDDNNECPVQYGHIYDNDDNVITICGGAARENDICEIKGHIVSIYFDAIAVTRYQFLLKYEAIGCPHYQPPPYTWVENQNNSIKVGCLSSDTTWKVKCMNKIWLGQGLDCPIYTTEAMVTKSIVHTNDFDNTDSTLPHVSSNHVIAFAVGCLTLIICCVIIILGIYCSKRYEVKINKHRHNVAAHRPLTSEEMAMFSCSSNPTGNINTYRPIHRNNQNTHNTLHSISESTMLPPYMHTFPRSCKSGTNQKLSRQVATPSAQGIDALGSGFDPAFPYQNNKTATPYSSHDLIKDSFLMGSTDIASGNALTNFNLTESERRQDGRTLVNSHSDPFLVNYNDDGINGCKQHGAIGSNINGNQRYNTFQGGDDKVMYYVLEHPADNMYTGQPTSQVNPNFQRNNSYPFV